MDALTMGKQWVVNGLKMGYKCPNKLKINDLRWSKSTLFRTIKLYQERSGLID
jgi:hypothetical protein